MFEGTLEWINQADYDIDTAEAMFQSGRYIYTIFMIHLAIEKSLKAVLVENSHETPPKIHNLVLLLKQTNIQLPEPLNKFIMRLSMAGVSLRYPEELSKTLEKYPKTIAQEYLKMAREVLECLKQKVI